MLASTKRRILIICPTWIGDTVIAQALFKFIKHNDPDSCLDVLAPEGTHALLERMPEINRIHLLPFKHRDLKLKQRWQLGKQLRSQQYNQAIVLPNSWKSAIIPAAAQIQQRTGWLGEMRFLLLNDMRYLNKQTWPLMVERFLALGLPQKTAQLIDWHAYQPRLMVSANALLNTLNRWGLSASRQPILALCPGAEFGPSKRWPAEYFAAVAKKKLHDHWQVWLLGSQQEQESAHIIQAITQNACVDLTGKTTLAEVIDLLSLANTVVSNDSGLMHIAAALQRPLIVIYGSSSPQFTPPLSENTKMLCLHLACSPCFKRICPLEHLKCLKELKPDRVLEAMDQLLLH